jgi:hypothetical protein
MSQIGFDIVKTQVDLGSPSNHTNIHSTDRPTVINPAPELLQEIYNDRALP